LKPRAHAGYLFAISFADFSPQIFQISQPLLTFATIIMDQYWEYESWDHQRGFPSSVPNNPEMYAQATSATLFQQISGVGS
jgi:hypothetical protein